LADVTFARLPTQCTLYNRKDTPRANCEVWSGSRFFRTRAQTISAGAFFLTSGVSPVRWSYGGGVQPRMSGWNPRHKGQSMTSPLYQCVDVKYSGSLMHCFLGCCVVKQASTVGVRDTLFCVPRVFYHKIRHGIRWSSGYSPCTNSIIQPPGSCYVRRPFSSIAARCILGQAHYCASPRLFYSCC